MTCDGHLLNRLAELRAAALDFGTAAASSWLQIDASRNLTTCWFRAARPVQFGARAYCTRRLRTRNTTPVLIDLNTIDLNKYGPSLGRYHSSFWVPNMASKNEAFLSY